MERLNYEIRKKRLQEAMNSDLINFPEKLADFIADILGCPVTIEDANHQLISYSKHTDKTDQARIFTIIQRQVPDHVINVLWKSGVMKRLFESDEPVIIPAIPEIDLFNRVAISIWDYHHVIGFIWAHADGKTFSNQDLQLLKIAAELVKKYLVQYRSGNRTREKEYRDFLWNLLLGGLKEEQRILHMARRYALDLSGFLAIIIIDFGQEITDVLKQHVNHLFKRLQEVDVAAYLYDQQQLILLVRIKDKVDSTVVLQDFIQMFVHEIGKKDQLDNIVGGSGFIYDSPEHLHYSYQQAKKVISLKRKLPHLMQDIYTYQDLGIYQFLDDLYEIKLKENYKNMVIEKLREHDYKNHTEYLKTLRVYLDCDCNVYEAAKKMHVHPNTLNYRLKRIGEISKINLKDPKQKTAVYLDLLLEKWYT